MYKLILLNYKKCNRTFSLELGFVSIKKINTVRKEKKF